MCAGIYFAFTFNVKPGTWDQPSASDIKEPITVELVCLSSVQVDNILSSAVSGEPTDCTKRTEAIRKEVVCMSVARWLSRRPTGVTFHGVARHVVDNVPVWVQEAITQRARELYSESMRTPSGF